MHIMVEMSEVLEHSSCHRAFSHVVRHPCRTRGPCLLQAEEENDLPTPPGQPSLPVIDNVHHIPQHAAWMEFNKMGEKYGEAPGEGRMLVILLTICCTSTHLDDGSLSLTLRRLHMTCLTRGVRSTRTDRISP
ncbi:hypothetical protein NEOLEDRAFT_558297 [Neolentinus lepideus HHB14362 ss-1]|uniref:Uncharacterized protein n=1 Tax=Neolentinus lepideus HHB14362 ss-1 TaxID=1314782 RepID=A0A165R5X9_9AGAM|nr:hypothetical protein NEOLEDRAFT_558297 [Neolentinus lepideus HHB14362 ss-1]